MKIRSIVCEIQDSTFVGFGKIGSVRFYGAQRPPGLYLRCAVGFGVAAVLFFAPIFAFCQPALEGMLPRPGAAISTTSTTRPAQDTIASQTQPSSVRLPTVQSPPDETKTQPIEKGGDEVPESKIATPPAPGEDEMVYLNVQDQDIKDVIKQISKATGKNFIIDDKVRGKVTIMSEKRMSKEEAYQAFLSAMEVAGFTTVTGPGGIIKVVALKDAVSEPIPIHVDSTPYTDSYITRLIALKNISALDMSNAIKGLISKSGNMFAYPATNTLIITDSGTNIDRLMKIIKELDQEGPQQVLEIVPINYADAKDIAQKVLQLFEIEKAAGGAPRKAGEAVMEEIKDVSKIIADDRTNSLIVLASKRAIDKVRDIIAKLDVPLKQGDTGQIHVHYLKYAKATELAQTLASIMSGAKAAKPPAAGGEKGAAPAAKGPPPVAQLEGGVAIGADETTNALIITASAKDYQVLVDELLSKLDIPSRQVYLESIVMELEVEKNKDFGVSGHGGGGNNTLLGFGTAGNINPSAVQGLFSPTGFFSTPGFLGGLLAKDKISIDVPQANGGTQTLEIPAFSAFLNMVQTYRDANIISTPNILTVDNQKASIEVTRKRYIPQTTITATAGATTAGSQPVEAGLTLEITPQITEGDAVRLQIHQKLSNFTGEATATLGPPETKREITTTVVAMDGQTVVLGGLMNDEITHNKSKVPLLGDIPLIGLLFQRNQTHNQKTNLLIFITPHVIKDPSDFAEVSKTKIDQRNSFIENNFGKKQQRQIKELIAAHRVDLLEYTPPVRTEFPQASSTVLPPPASMPLPSPAAPSPAAMPPPPVAVPPPSSKPPVITVPSAGAQSYSGPALASSSSPRSAPVLPSSSSQKKGIGEVDLAY